MKEGLISYYYWWQSEIQLPVAEILRQFDRNSTWWLFHAISHLSGGAGMYWINLSTQPLSSLVLAYRGSQTCPQWEVRVIYLHRVFFLNGYHICVCLILIPGKKISWWHVDKVACKSLAIRMYTQMRGVYVARVSLFYLKMHRLGLEINHREQESRFWCWHWVQSKAAPSFGKPIDLRTAPFYWSYQQTQSFIKQVRQCMDWLHTRKLNGKVIEFSTSEPKCLGIVKAPS